MRVNRYTRSFSLNRVDKQVNATLVAFCRKLNKSTNVVRRA